MFEFKTGSKQVSLDDLKILILEWVRESTGKEAEVVVHLHNGRATMGLDSFTSASGKKTIGGGGRSMGLCTTSAFGIKSMRVGVGAGLTTSAISLGKKSCSGSLSIAMTVLTSSKYFKSGRGKPVLALFAHTSASGDSMVPIENLIPTVSIKDEVIILDFKDLLATTTINSYGGALG